jgi:hypothetical protein
MKKVASKVVNLVNISSSFHKNFDLLAISANQCHLESEDSSFAHRINVRSSVLEIKGSLFELLAIQEQEWSLALSVSKIKVSTFVN